MSTFTANRFALLAEDGESPDPAPVAKKPAVPAAQATKTIPGQAARKPAQAPSTQSNRAPRRQGAAGDGEPPLGGEPSNRDERGDRRGRGGFRGDRGGFRGRGRGKNDRLDRHSATGTQDTEKKIASGWGADEGRSELRAAAEADGDVKAEDTAPDAAAANGAEDAVAAEVPQQEEDKTKTLDQYLAERAAAAVSPQFRVREANEGTDESQWKDGVEVVKGAAETEDFFSGKAKKAPAAKKHVKEKLTLDVEPVAYRPPRDARGGDRGGDRGGRGRGAGRGRGEGGARGTERGGGGRGSGRGSYSSRGARGSGAPGSRGFDADDQSAFPSLS